MGTLKAVLRDLLVALAVGLAIGLAACLLFGLLGGLIGGSVRSGVVAARSAVLQNYVRMLEQQVSPGYAETETVNTKLADQFK